eukprot:5310646-Alexandrium_andersonii.AAC.1
MHLARKIREALPWSLLSPFTPPCRLGRSGDWDRPSIREPGAPCARAPTAPGWAADGRGDGGFPKGRGPGVSWKLRPRGRTDSTS